MHKTFAIAIRTLLLPVVFSLIFALASCGENNSRDEHQTVDAISRKKNAVIVAEKQKNEQPDMHARHDSLAKNFAHQDIVILDAPYQLSEPAKSAMDKLIDAYIQLKDALVRDEEDATDKAVDLLAEAVAAIIPTQLNGRGLEAWQNHQMLYESKLKEMRHTKGLENKRSYFSHISEIIYCTIKSFGVKKGELFAVFCAMAFDGKGAYWRRFAVLSG